jgi:GPI mannosyltransferase 2
MTRILSWPHTRHGRIVLLALSSRIACLTLMSLAGASFASLDTSARLESFACLSQKSDAETIPKDAATSQQFTSLQELSVWDSAYFVRIAKCGYEHDMTNAFFPLLPLCMRLAGQLSRLVLAQGTPISVESLYMGVGLVINVIAFCIAALALHHLSATILKDVGLADLATLMFCFNPASVFYSAAYTEALFAACSWTGVALLSTGTAKYYWCGVLLLSAASAARSNGILACWFVLYGMALEAIRTRRLRKMSVVKSGFACLCILAPYATMQYRAYRWYCTAASETTLFEPRPAFCFATVPSMYGYVQARYWDVGFLTFYKKLDRVGCMLLLCFECLSKMVDAL